MDTDVEERKEATPGGTPIGEKPSDEEISEMERNEQIENESKKNQVLRSMLDGFKFNLKVEGIKISLYGQENIRF